MKKFFIDIYNNKLYKNYILTPINIIYYNYIIKL